MRRIMIFALLPLLNPMYAIAQDLVSGPEKGSKVPALKVFDVTGLKKEKEADYAAERREQPTIYLFVSADKFDRPMNRFMKELDTAIIKDLGEAYVVAVWLTPDTDKTKEYLPKVQQSVQYGVTALTVFPGDKEGPKPWKVNGDAHLTAVLAHEGTVVATFGYRSLNETNVPMVIAALKKAIQKK
jgi:hypothetical protein